MISEELLDDLRSFLFHLYDPAYAPGHRVRLAAGCPATVESECSRAAILYAIDSLRPASGVPFSSRMNRLYQLLVHRFVQAQTQEETSAILGLTPRHLRREEREAIVLLAQRLVDLSPKADYNTLPAGVEQPSRYLNQAGDDASSNWSLQLQQELTSLQKSEKGQGSAVAEVVHKATELCRPLGKLCGIDLIIKPLEPSLRASISSPVLRQVLVMSLEALMGCSAEGRITIEGECTGNSIVLRLSSAQRNPPAHPNLEKAGTLLALQGGAYEIRSSQHQLTIDLVLLSLREKTVLVVDDNQDIVYLYERYTAGTCYRVLRSEGEARLFQFVELHTPDIIILDVMMPQIDGWELLTELHEHPVTRAIPVVVCSVIQGELLAQSLGAALYLSKPITQEQFLAALDLAAALIKAQ